MKTRCCCSKRYLLVFSILLVSTGLNTKCGMNEM